MPSLYRNRDERVQDVVIAYLNEQASVRYSLTHGARYLPFTEDEKEIMRHEKAWALARLTIDKIMRLPDYANIKRYSKGKDLSTG